MPIYNSMQDVLREFSQKNPVWMACDTCFTAFVSDFGVGPGSSLLGIRDPWNRPFPVVPTPIYDKDNDIVSWSVLTSVNKQTIECKIFND